MAKGKLAKALSRELTAAKSIKAKNEKAKRKEMAEQLEKQRRKNRQNQHRKAYIPFEPTEKVLLVGEGDFSYAHSIASNGLAKGVVVASGLDTRSDVERKYPNSAPAYLAALESRDNVTILHEIDATKLSSTRPFSKELGTYDAIIFNFPHIGNSISHQDRNILQHQTLILNFLTAARPLLKSPHGRIVVTIFEGEPYISWNIKELAKSKGFRTLRSQNLDWSAFPGYGHRLTAKEGHTNKAQAQRKARIYAFIDKEAPEPEKKPSKTAESDEELLD